MTTARDDNPLSPLDQIRQAEAEVTARLASAREAAAQEQARLREENRRLLAEANETGRWEGQLAYRDAIAAAEEEARRIRAAGRERAAELQEQGRERMAAAVQYALAIVLGGPDGNER